MDNGSSSQTTDGPDEKAKTSIDLAQMNQNNYRDANNESLLTNHLKRSSRI